METGCSDATYLVHLEGSGNTLNEDSAANGATSHANVILSQVENIVPQPRLQMALHLWQVEVWATSSLY